MVKSWWNSNWRLCSGFWRQRGTVGLKGLGATTNVYNWGLWGLGFFLQTCRFSLKYLMCVHTVPVCPIIMNLEEDPAQNLTHHREVAQRQCTKEMCKQSKHWLVFNSRPCKKTTNKIMLLVHAGMPFILHSWPPPPPFRNMLLATQEVWPLSD